jgi:hypothetical protein
MAPPPLTRRHLLRSSLAAASGTAALLTTRAAGAFRVEEVAPGSTLAQLYGTRCGGPTEHQALIAALQAGLKERVARGETPAEQAATCPLCGCAVVVGVDEPR